MRIFNESLQACIVYNDLLDSILEGNDLIYSTYTINGRQYLNHNN